jgi:plasmid stability protein
MDASGAVRNSIMNLLVRDLSAKIVKELKKRAAGNNRSLQAELKVIVSETADRDSQLRKWRKATDQIYNELKKSGRTFSDSTELIREDRER